MSTVWFQHGSILHLPGAARYYPTMPTSSDDPIKETCRLIRLARSKWDAHDNSGCRTERDRALALYETLSREQKDEIPQVLRVWLRYRSEKYFGPDRTPPRGRRYQGRH